MYYVLSRNDHLIDFLDIKNSVLIALAWASSVRITRREAPCCTVTAATIYTTTGEAITSIARAFSDTFERIT